MSRYQAPRRPRTGLWVLLAVVIMVAAVVGMFAWDAVQLRDAADRLQVHAAGAKAAVSAHDVDALAQEVVAVESAAKDFSRASSGVHWWVANHVPWVKDQTLPLTQAGRSTLAIAEGALAPLSQMEDLSALQVPRIEDGRIDPWVLEPYRATLSQAADVVVTQQDALAAVDLTHTVAQVRDPFRDLRTQLGELGDIIVGGHVAAEVLPGMLGADAPRTYLVMVQNLAEPRTTGGIPGAVIEVTVDDGRFEIGRYVAAGSMVNTQGIDVALTPDEEAIFGDKMLVYPQDTNFTPQFPRTAELMAQFWRESQHERVDAVASLDPVALGYMLQGAPPIDVAGVAVNSTNAAQILMNQTYLMFEAPADQDAFFEVAAQAVFTAMLQGDGDVVGGTTRALDEGRFMVWSANQDEQALLERTQISGAFLTRGNSLGVFLSDGSGSKIGYYLDMQVAVTDLMCPSGELRGQRVDVTLTHTFDGAVEDLPEYISGGGVFVPAGEFHGNVVLYPQRDMGVLGMMQDGATGAMNGHAHGDRTRVAAWVELAPGQTTHLVFDVVANAPGIEPQGITVTPRPTTVPITRTLDVWQGDC